MLACPGVSLMRWRSASYGVTRASRDETAVGDFGADLRLDAMQGDPGAAGLDDGAAGLTVDGYGVAGADELVAMSLVAAGVVGGWVASEGASAGERCLDGLGAMLEFHREDDIAMTAPIVTGDGEAGGSEPGSMLRAMSWTADCSRVRSRRRMPKMPRTWCGTARPLASSLRARAGWQGMSGSPPTA